MQQWSSQVSKYVLHNSKSGSTHTQTHIPVFCFNLINWGWFRWGICVSSVLTMANFAATQFFSLSKIYITNVTQLKINCHELSMLCRAFMCSCWTIFPIMQCCVNFGTGHCLLQSQVLHESQKEQRISFKDS